jgi:hypothetical protein
MKYVRDARTGALLLRDNQKISEFSEKRSVLEELNELKTQIDTMRQELIHMRTKLEQLTKSN